MKYTQIKDALTSFKTITTPNSITPAVLGQLIHDCFTHKSNSNYLNFRMLIIREAGVFKYKVLQNDLSINPADIIFQQTLSQRYDLIFPASLVVNDIKAVYAMSSYQFIGNYISLINTNQLKTSFRNIDGSEMSNDMLQPHLLDLYFDSDMLEGLPHSYVNV